MRPIRVFLLDVLCTVPYYVSALCAALRQEGLEATLGSITYYRDRAHFRRLNLKPQPGLLDLTAHLALPNATLRRALKFLEATLNLAALSVRFLFRRPDILHVQYLPLLPHGVPFELWFIQLTRKLGSRIVYTVHDRLPPDTGGSHHARFARIYRMADALICHSEDARADLRRDFSLPDDRLWVIPHGPLFADLHGPEPVQARRRLGLPEQGCVVLWQGIIKPYKGILFLLEAWAALLRREPNARLVVVGTGEPALLEQIRQQAAALGITDSVRLDFRFIPVEDLATYYEAADVVVYPYREITTSGALLTGLARRKAIIATALPAFRELLRHGENALLVEYGDVPQLSEALSALMADPAERERLARSAATVLGEQNSWAAIARQTRRCYETLLKNPSPTP